VRSALQSIDGKYVRIFGYDASDADDPWEIWDVAVPDWANDLRELRPGFGYWLLVTEDAGEARRFAERLESYNAERKTIESVVLDQALAQAEALAESGAPLILAAGAGWHPGVIGIVASRLKERFNRPALVVALDGAVGKGSGRSVPGVDLGAAVLAARQAGLLLDGGGHAMAAGLTVAEAALPELRAFLEARLGPALANAGPLGGLGLDGVHLNDGARQVRAARKSLGRDAIVGAFCGTSRHEGMNAGEAGADYVSFGPVGDTALGVGTRADRALFEWWSEMIELPVVAEGALDAGLVPDLAPVTDFLAIGTEIWDRDDPVAALGRLIAAMR